MTQLSKVSVPRAPEMVRCEEPKEIQEMRARQLRNPMPSDFRQIHIVNLLAVNVNFKVVTQTRHPFDKVPLRAVAFVEKRGDNGKSIFSGCVHYALHSDLQQLTSTRHTTPRATALNRQIPPDGSVPPAPSLYFRRDTLLVLHLAKFPPRIRFCPPFRK